MRGRIELEALVESFEITQLKWYKHLIDYQKKEHKKRLRKKSWETRFTAICNLHINK